MPKENTLYCSFCGKSQHEVRKLIAGPTVFICDECVVLCMDIISDKHKAVLAKSRDGVPTPDEISKLLDGLDEAQDHVRSVLSQVLHRHYRCLIDGANGRSAASPPSHLLLTGASLDRSMVARAVSRLDFPVVALGATKLMEVGHAIDILHAIALELIEVVDYNLRRALCGIVFIDDFDRLGGTRDLPLGRADHPAQNVQKALIDVMSGTFVEVDPSRGGRKSHGAFALDTSTLTVICGGFFTSLSESGTLENERQSGDQRPVKDDAGDPGELPSFREEDFRRLVGLGFSPDLVRCFSTHLILT
jgi:ATP-dependent Clp protease ATP-binding subunit ClpX